MVRKRKSKIKSNSKGSLLGRSSSSSNKEKTGLFLVAIVAVVAVVALFLMVSGNGVSILGDDSALAGQASELNLAKGVSILGDDSELAGQTFELTLAKLDSELLDDIKSIVSTSDTSVRIELASNLASKINNLDYESLTPNIIENLIIENLEDMHINDIRYFNQMIEQINQMLNEIQYLIQNSGDGFIDGDGTYYGFGWDDHGNHGTVVTKPDGTRTHSYDVILTDENGKEYTVTIKTTTHPDGTTTTTKVIKEESESITWESEFGVRMLTELGTAFDPTELLKDDIVYSYEIAMFSYMLYHGFII